MCTSEINHDIVLIRRIKKLFKEIIKIFIVRIAVV
jgi:hypothetical protein